MDVVADNEHRKLFSCEPCRRAKLKCDHNSPICGRCARRGKQSECMYHPAPLTKPRTGLGPQRTMSIPRAHDSTQSSYPATGADGSRPSDSLSPPSSTRTLSAQKQTVSGSTDSRSLGYRSAEASPAGHMPYSSNEGSQPPSTASVQIPESDMSFRDISQGYLGATSYSAVYAEHQSILQTPHVEETPENLLPVTSVEKIQQGAQVLSILKDFPVYRQFMQRWFELSDGIMVM